MSKTKVGDLISKPKGRKTPKINHVPTPKATYNYYQFYLDSANREADIGNKHVHDIMLSFLKYPELIPYRPALVGKDNVIVEGQHTLMALILHEKEKGKVLSPFYYYKDSKITIAHAAPLNAVQKKWGTRQWINFYADRGFGTYQELRNYLKEYPVPANIGMAMFYKGQHKPGGEAQNRFKNGYLDASYKSFAIEVGEELKTLRDNFGYNFVFKYSFIVAWVRLKKSYSQDSSGVLDKFKPDVFFKKLKQDTNQLRKEPGYSDYMRSIQQIYDRHRQKKTRLY